MRRAADAASTRTPARWKATPTVTAPAVWPSSRAVASMPPAAPERGLGAALTIVRLLGDWNRPKPSAAHRHPPGDVEIVGRGAQPRQQEQAGREDREADAAEQPGRHLVGEPPGERRGDADRDRPGSHQQARSRTRSARAPTGTGTEARHRPASAPRTTRSRCAIDSVKIGIRSRSSGISGLRLAPFAPAPARLRRRCPRATSAAPSRRLSRANVSAPKTMQPIIARARAAPTASRTAGRARAGPAAPCGRRSAPRSRSAG